MEHLFSQYYLVFFIIVICFLVLFLNVMIINATLINLNAPPLVDLYLARSTKSEYSESFKVFFILKIISTNT